MKRWKQAAVISCAVLMAISAAGCGKKEAETEKSASAAEERTVENASGQQNETAAETEDAETAENAADAVKDSDTSESAGNGAAEDAAAPAEEELSADRIPPVLAFRHYDADVNMNYDGLAVLSGDFEALDSALHGHNHLVEAKALGHKDSLEGDSDYQYSDTAVITRCDRTVLSFTQEFYCYLGQSDARPSLTGYTFDVNSGKELKASDVITDETAFSEAFMEKLDAHPDREAFQQGWEDRAEEDLLSLSEFSWCLKDDALELIFPAGLIEALDDVTVEVPYAECGSFLKERYLNDSALLCHLVDDYGEYCLEYSFDADGDGRDELLQIDADYNVNEDHYVESVRPIISFGRDAGSLITAEAEYDDIYEMGNSWVMETEEGKYFLYVEVMVSDDTHLLMIYDLSDPDAGPVYTGDNMTGAFCGFAPTDPEQLYVESRVYCMGTWTGYTECRIGVNGQLGPVVEEEPEYRILSFDDETLFDSDALYTGQSYALTLKQDIEVYVFDEVGDGEYETLTAGTKLYPYSSAGGSYMTFRLEDGMRIQLFYDDMDENDWQRKIMGIPEEDLLDGMIYAG